MKRVFVQFESELHSTAEKKIHNKCVYAGKIIGEHEFSFYIGEMKKEKSEKCVF